MTTINTTTTMATSINEDGSPITITITFSVKQFEALKSLMWMMDDTERQYVADHYDTFEGMKHPQLPHLNEIGAGETNYADLQRVWNAINRTGGDELEGEDIKEEDREEDEEEDSEETEKELEEIKKKQRLALLDLQFAKMTGLINSSAINSFSK